MCVCVCVRVCWESGWGGLDRPTTNMLGGGFQTEAKCEFPLWFLLPVLMQLPTLKTLRSVIAVKCREQQSRKELGERDESGGCALVVLLHLSAVVALLKKRMHSKDAGSACGLVGLFAA